MIWAMRSHPLLRFFEYGHLPAELQKISGPFRQQAIRLINDLPAASLEPGGQGTLALQRLLDSKDAAVRASLPQD